MMILALLACSHQSAAQTAAVAAGSCLHGVKSYPTIQEAVNSAPSGGTVFVCPGTYTEQVTITSPLKLAGIRSAGQAASTIVAPATLVPNATSPTGGFSFPALLAVQGASGVSVSDIVVDGGGINCTWLICAGIAFEGSSGIVKSSVVRNFTNTTSSGVAIDADGSTLTAQGNSLHQFNWGILAANCTLTLRGNVISAGLVAISVNQSAGAVIANNNLQLTVGVPLFLSAVSGTMVWGNTIEAPADNAAIVLQQSQNNTITGNRIIGGFAGVSLVFEGFLPANTGNVIKANFLFNTNIGVMINDGGAPGGNTITNNSMIEANCGVETGNSIGDTLTPNNLLGVVAATCP